MRYATVSLSYGISCRTWYHGADSAAASYSALAEAPLCPLLPRRVYAVDGDLAVNHVSCP